MMLCLSKKITGEVVFISFKGYYCVMYSTKHNTSLAVGLNLLCDDLMHATFLITLKQYLSAWRQHKPDAE